MVLLDNYHSVIDAALRDATSVPQSAAQAPRVAPFQQAHLADSFDEFLPFSDSVFLVSQNADMFVQQVSHFLLGAFLTTGHAFAYPESEEDPTAVTFPVAHPTEDGRSGLEQGIGHWFPTLFRGGVTFGEVVTASVPSVHRGCRGSVVNLVGPAVIRAVELEASGKGPRLFCDRSFADRLGDPTRRYLADAGHAQEILWPAYLYIGDSNPERSVLQFPDIFYPAANLWKAFNHTPVAEHYYSFVRLVVHATLRHFELEGTTEVVRTRLERFVRDAGLGSKWNDLLCSYREGAIPTRDAG